MGYFYDSGVAECPEHFACEERFACPGCLQWADSRVKLASGGCIYAYTASIKLDFQKNKKSPLPSQAAATIFKSKSLNN